MNGGVTTETFGSTYQFIFSRFFAVYQAAADSVTAHVLTTMGGTLASALGFFIIIWGVSVGTGHLDASTFASRATRAFLVVHLTMAPMWAQFVVKPLTVDAPALIAQAVGGQPNTVQGGSDGSQVFDKINAVLVNTGSKIRAQMPGMVYAGDRAAVWIFEAVARGENAAAWAAYALARLLLLFVPVLVALTSWTWLFKATEHIGGRILGVGVGLLCMVALTILTATVTTNVEIEFLTRFVSQLPQASSDAGFKMASGDPNGGVLNFTGFSEVGALGNMAGDVQAARQFATINSDASAELMASAATVLFIGMLSLGACTGICAAIACAPISATWAVASATRAVNRLASRITAGRRR